MMKSGSRMESPPAAYAKYLDDFEECDESQLAPVTARRSSTHRDSREYENCHGSKALNINRFTSPSPSTSHSHAEFSASSGRCGFEGYDGYAASAVGIPPRYQGAQGEFYTGYSVYDKDVQRTAYQANENGAADISTRSPPRRSKSIHDVKVKNKKPSMKGAKICYAFAKFGDCHYGENCKFSHDPELLKAEQKMEIQYGLQADERNTLKPILCEMENSDATCRQLEQRLLEIQRELSLLEEESKKPKSSVVVPKHCQPLFPSTSDHFGKSTHAAFNVGGDFIVRVGSSRREQPRRSKERDNHHNDDSSRSEKYRANITSTENKRRRAEEGLHQKTKRQKREEVFPRSSKNKRSRRERRSKRNELRDVSDDERATGHRNNAPLSLDDLHADQISSSGTESGEEVRKQKQPQKGKENLVADLISDDSSVNGGSVHSEGEDVQEACLVSDEELDVDEISADDNESTIEPLELSSVVDPKQLVEISDDELPQDQDGPSTSFAKEPSSCRLENSMPYVLRDSTIIFEKLHPDLVAKLKEYRIEDVGVRECQEEDDILEDGRLLAGFEQRERLQKFSQKLRQPNEEEWSKLREIEMEVKNLFDDE